MHPLYPLLTNEDAAADRHELLVKRISGLISSDFQQLVQILYRIDVSEDSLRKALELQPEKDAAVLIADLIIERVSKKKVLKNIDSKDILEEDRW